MSAPRASLADRAAALRQAFDETFARKVEPAAAAPAGFLAIGLGGHPHLLRLADIARLLRTRGLLRTPHPSAAWLGLAGSGGQALPVYDLAVLAGYPPSPAPGPAPKWMVVSAVAPVALAFEVFEGQVRLEADDAAATVRHVAGTARALVDMQAVLQAVRSLARAGT